MVRHCVPSVVALLRDSSPAFEKLSCQVTAHFVEVAGAEADRAAERRGTGTGCSFRRRASKRIKNRKQNRRQRRTRSRNGNIWIHSGGWYSSLQTR
ncbi:hypothetical protein GUJ93_ZPchr0012g19244 [Zizania palustris]|uniref:Uncharacterized protein n=1 Tax=Zizania palustris TaxID=103762 RepID=A0A8J5WKI1_ZIZPA|nr:hypothetical protein GUJ93_ZPchr0012g19244 [Zizania palustris]